jgi:hypothetical protein
MLLIDFARIIHLEQQVRNHSHLISTVSETELHHFVAKLAGTVYKFHNKPFRPHYDLFDQSIELAITLGAQQVSTCQLIRYLQQLYPRY